jgi:hypothetical protein
MCDSSYNRRGWSSIRSATGSRPRFSTPSWIWTNTPLPPRRRRYAFEVAPGRFVPWGPAFTDLEHQLEMFAAAGVDAVISSSGSFGDVDRLEAGRAGEVAHALNAERSSCRASAPRTLLVSQPCRGRTPTLPSRRWTTPSCTSACGACWCTPTSTVRRSTRTTAGPSMPASPNWVFLCSSTRPARSPKNDCATTGSNTSSASCSTRAWPPCGWCSTASSRRTRA